MSSEPIQHNETQPEKLIHLALPVRLTHMVHGNRGPLEMACTYDIHPRGGRLLSFSRMQIGDLVTIERGRNRSVCQVAWAADPDSPLRGQFTVQLVDGGKVPWEEELRQAEEHYLPVTPDALRKSAMNAYRRGDQNRRRRPRFFVEGGAELAEIGGSNAHLEGHLAQISELGCLITAPDLLLPGTEIKLALNVHDISVALKGTVKYMAEKLGMGVEFHEIRQGDAPLLNYILKQLSGRRVEAFSDLEVVTEPLAAVAG